MLKLQCTESGMFMEPISDSSLELLVAQRVVLALRTGHVLYVEPGRASFLIAAEVSRLTQLQQELQQQPNQSVALMPVDEAFVEVSVAGTWLAEQVDAEAGIFAIELSDRAESLIHQLWQATQPTVSYSGPS